MVGQSARISGKHLGWTHLGDSVLSVTDSGRKPDAKVLP
jgi:hypothetical protein